MEVIKSIEQIEGLRLANIGSHTGSKGARIGIRQAINALWSGIGEYDGYKIATTEHEYLVLIDNGQCCCESWGYFSTNDNPEDFVGETLAAVEITDKALNTKEVEKSGYYDSAGGIQFVNFKTARGGVLQFAVYNAHNGYYGHPIIIAKDEEILHQDTL